MTRSIAHAQADVSGPRHAVSRRRRDARAPILIVSGAVAVALWLGFTAPSVSPVAPPPVAAPASTAPIVPGSMQPGVVGP